MNDFKRNNWQVDKNVAENYLPIYQNGAKLITEVHTPSTTAVDRLTAESNAYILSAAQEALAACEMLVKLNKESDFSLSEEGLKAHRLAVKAILKSRNHEGKTLEESNRLLGIK